VPKISSKPKSEYAIQTVLNALRMLEVFHTESEMGVSDLARRLDLHKNNAFRLLATLELAGYIQQTPKTELYHLGPRCLELGHAFARSHSLIDQARPILEELASSVGETVHLGVRTGAEVVHLDGVLPEQLVLTGLRVGQRAPAHCTALGKVLLSGDDVDLFDESFWAADGLLAAGALSAAGASNAGAPLAFERFTEATCVDPAKLTDELRAVALNGYAADLEEFSAGLHCVAAPVHDASSRVVAALSISGPSFRLSPEVLHGEGAQAVTRAATQLSQKLGSPI
jgi:IclR family KDG regulon transcriptional repressor